MVLPKARIPFVQEFRHKRGSRRVLPDPTCLLNSVVRNAKIVFLSEYGGSYERFLRGRTGAFIDQMATLLRLTPSEMNEKAEKHEKIYTIASRCGVFAKSDIQPLLNQGASREDISASIFYAVVNQTVGGLAQGRPIEGNVVYLGGPLTFLPRGKFDKTLA
jgi:hypothetical protein